MENLRGFQIVTDVHRKHKQLYPLPNGEVLTHFTNIKLPQRATRKSAAYDFYLPSDVMLLPNSQFIIDTDVKAYMQDDEALFVYIRSNLGIHQGIVLAHGTGLIDADYYENPKNDGNISIPILNTTGRGIELKAGQRIAQGVFKKYLLADNDEPINEERTGGSGSSGQF